MVSLDEALGAQITEDRGQTLVQVGRDKVIDTLRALKDQGFNALIDITSLDYQGYPDPKPERFCVVYQLCNFESDATVRVRAGVPEEAPKIASATALWPAANWPEREVFDLMGISFEGHPDLRRILLPDIFDKHPLRKEYPVQGTGERDSFEKYHR